MASRGQTHAPRERERALKERRERKRAKKDQRAADNAPAIGSGDTAPEAGGQEAETEAPEWIQ